MTRSLDSPRRSSKGKHGKHAIRRPSRFGRLGEVFSERLWLRVVGIALLSLAAGAAGFFLLLPLVSGDDGGPAPEDTVLSLFEAARRGDCETAVELVTDEFWSDDGSSDTNGLEVCQGYVNSQTPGWVDDYTVREVALRSEEGDTATVAVGLAPEFGSAAPPEWVASLVKRDGGTWLVENVEVTDSSGSPADTDGGTQGSEGEGPAAPAADAPGGRPQPPPTGGGPELDALAARCYQGDMGACDELFDATFDEGNEYGSASRPHTEYGASCGGRFTGEVTEYCEDLVPDSSG